MESNQVDPSTLIPKVFHQYLYFPYKAVGIWSVLFVVCLLAAYLFPVTPEGSDSSSSSSITISASEPCAFSGSVTPTGLVISDSSLSGSVVTRQPDDSLILQDPSGSIISTLKQITVEEGVILEIYNAAGQLQFVTKPDDEGYKILSSERELVSRVKFKEEKFNIYNSSGERIYYGKEKKGSIVIRNDTGSDLIWISASNNPPLTQIAPLCLPIGETAKALLYANELVKSGAL